MKGETYLLVGALDHPKTKGLKARLQCSRAQVIGHLELLWAFTAQHAPQGDIGKWGDEEIAEACDWSEHGERGPGFFVQGLVEKGFLDNSAAHRLLVHDWPDHAPRWVLAKLRKAGLNFISEPTIVPSKEGTTVASIEGSTVDTTEPSLFSSKGSQGSPREKTKPKIAPDGAEGGVEAKPGRPKDLLWEAMLGACGIPLTAEIPKSARGAYNSALKDLRDIGATPASIHAHAQAFRRKWKSVSLTPTALARRWNECVVVDGGGR